MFMYECCTTAYTALIRMVFNHVAIPMKHPVFHKISGCHWAIATIAPRRLQRLLRLLTLSKTPRETLTPATWQHVNYLMDGGIMEEFTC